MDYLFSNLKIKKKMKTVFKVGMKVYDQFNSPDMEGVVVEVIDNECDDYPIGVSFLNRYDICYYTPEGRFNKRDIPTLSTKPYKVEFQGFEQKAPAPTYEDIVKERNYIYLPENLVAPNKELADAVVALLKLLFLRDYYNEGWQPDWKKEREMKYVIYNDSNKLATIQSYTMGFILAFKEGNIRNKFLEEQRELLEIAKPLL